MENKEVFHVDIINEILLKLPAKSLLRFKSVCKSWYNLISGRDFANKHLQRSLITHSNLHLVFRTSALLMVDYDTYENDVELNHPYKKLGARGRASIIGYCNGLLCLWNYDGVNRSVCVYNPTTQTHNMIPDVQRLFHGRPHLSGRFSFGFGYDSVKDDYKFVRIFQCSLEEMETGYSYDEVAVFSLKSNSWTRVLDHVPVDFDSHPDGVLANDNLHWVNCKSYYDPPNVKIVSFNLSTNILSEVPLPKAYTDAYGVIHAGVLDGCLCLLMYGYQEFKIVVMKEYGVVDSWAQLIRFSTNKIAFTIEKAIAFTRNRKRLLVVLDSYHSYQFASIDLETLVLKKINSSANALTNILNGTICVENLLMLDDFIDLENKPHWQDNSNKRKRDTVGEDVEDTPGTNEKLFGTV